MRTVLHVLPHRGGGAEKYIDLLAGVPDTRHERVALSSGRTPASAAFSLPRSYAGVARLARRSDVVHVHGDAAAILALPLLRRPSVFTTHGLHLLRRHHSVARGVRAAVNLADVTLCTSEAEERELALLAPRFRNRLVLARNGLPPAPAPDAAVREAARRELGLADRDVAVLFLGALEARKGPQEAVAAAAAVRAAGAPVTLLLAGDGPLRAELAASGRAGVLALGHRDDPERLLAAADVFVLPSAREGLSFAVLEAMQAGLAVVVADGPGNPEAVGDAGLVVPAGDVAALTAVLTALATDPDRRRALGDAARRRVERDFGIDGLVAAVDAAYATALA